MQSSCIFIEPSWNVVQMYGLACQPYGVESGRVQEPTWIVRVVRALAGVRLGIFHFAGLKYVDDEGLMTQRIQHVAAGRAA
jgi:hypothetical protein